MGAKEFTLYLSHIRPKAQISRQIHGNDLGYQSQSQDQMMANSTRHNPVIAGQGHSNGASLRWNSEFSPQVGAESTGWKSLVLQQSSARSWRPWTGQKWAHKQLGVLGGLAKAGKGVRALMVPSVQLWLATSCYSQTTAGFM